MDSARTTQFRALALASRCLAREIRRRDGAIAGDAIRSDSPRDIARSVRLARDVLSPKKKAPNPGRVPMRTQNPLIDLLGDGPPSPEHSLVLLGHGAVTPIPELVGFLGTLGVDGVLQVGTENERFVLEFSGGQIVHGEASRAPLGDRLVARGDVDRAVLEDRIQQLFCRLFRSEPKSFTFWQGPPLHAHDGVRLNSTSLLLEGARVHDESDEVEDVLVREEA